MTSTMIAQHGYITHDQNGSIIFDAAHTGTDEGIIYVIPEDGEANIHHHVFYDSIIREIPVKLASQLIKSNDKHDKMATLKTHSIGEL